MTTRLLLCQTFPLLPSWEQWHRHLERYFFNGENVNKLKQQVKGISELHVTRIFLGWEIRKVSLQLCLTASLAHTLLIIWSTEMTSSPLMRFEWFNFTWILPSAGILNVEQTVVGCFEWLRSWSKCSPNGHICMPCFVDADFSLSNLHPLRSYMWSAH